MVINNDQVYHIYLSEDIDVLIDEIESNKTRVRIMNIEESNTTNFQIETSIKNIEVIKNMTLKFIEEHYNKKLKYIKIEKVQAAYYSSK